MSIDHTAPVLDVFGLVGRQGRRELFVHNSTDLSKMVLQVHAGDIHSGLRTLQWTLGTTDQTADVGEDAVGIQRLGNIVRQLLVYLFIFIYILIVVGNISNISLFSSLMFS